MEIVQLSFLDGKVCRLCSTLQPLDNFFFRSESGKHRTECKACLSILHRQRYVKNHDVIRAKQKERHHERKDDPDYIQMRRATWMRNRDKALITKAEYRAARRDELSTKEHQRYHLKKDEINQKTREKKQQCPDIFREKKKREYQKNRDYQLRKSREWRLANPDRKRANNRRWFESNRQKIRQMSRISKAKRRDWAAGARYSLADWQAMCDCFNSVCLCCGSDAALTVDHVIPLSRGGTNTIENLQPLCRHCNLSKNNRHSTDYRDPDRLALFLASIGH